MLSLPGQARLNPQTIWVLKRLDIDAPVLLTDASPRFEAVTRRLDTAAPASPIREAWAILSRTRGIAPIVNPEDGKPCGLITGLSLLTSLSNYVGPHPRSQEMRLAELLDQPCHEACDTNVPCFQAGTRIRDVLNRILREEHNEFLIVDKNGVYLGVTRQRDVLNPPRMQVILVDHNEPSQSIGALEEAELVEILDHHRLGHMSTHIPIRFSVDVVGSTSTLVSERIEEAGLALHLRSQVCFWRACFQIRSSLRRLLRPIVINWRQSVCLVGLLSTTDLWMEKRLLRLGIRS